jgi:hypothetical protein
MLDPLAEYFRLPEHAASLRTAGPLPEAAGYFRFGDVTAYGRQCVGPASPRPDNGAVDVSPAVTSDAGTVVLPFDLREAVENLRCERYSAGPSGAERVSGSGLVHRIYYFLRPALPVHVRKHLQRARLAGRTRAAFPRWPVDVSVEKVMKGALRAVLEATGAETLPFIWFWPGGAPACVMMTHDVEGPAGVARAGALMDLDDRFGIRSSFQLVPEAPASRRLLEECRRRGFDVAIHDFNHDGHLFRDRRTFNERVRHINHYASEYGCAGFRSGALYRRQDWFSDLQFEFDMSVPNVAHLDPQRGGCCTVMPYFIGDLLELPVTTVQDYSLFHILGDYSTALWTRQLDEILAENGLISTIVHPDYLVGPRETGVYTALLSRLAALREERGVWIAPPSEVNAWWRQRAGMRLVRTADSWTIDGAGADRARLAFARLDGGRIAYELDAWRTAA